MRFGKREGLESLGDFENGFLFSVWLLSNVRLARLAHDPDPKKSTSNVSGAAGTFNLSLYYMLPWAWAAALNACRSLAAIKYTVNAIACDLTRRDREDSRARVRLSSHADLEAPFANDIATPRCVYEFDR